LGGVSAPYHFAQVAFHERAKLDADEQRQSTKERQEREIGCINLFQNAKLDCLNALKLLSKKVLNRSEFHSFEQSLKEAQEGFP